MNEKNKSIKEQYKEQINEAIDDLKRPGGLKKQIPNMLTASRLLSPLAIIPAAITGNTAFAAIAAAFFGLTDFVDGRLAKAWDAQSKLGADLDAFTDKIFAGTLLIGGAIFNPILVSNIILEMAIAGINLKQKFSGKEPKSTQTGRIKTWFLFALGGLGIIAPALNLAPAIIPALSIATAAMQGATVVSYLNKYSNQDQQAPKQPETITETPVEQDQPIIHEPETKDLTKTYDTGSESNITQQIDPELEALAAAMVEQEANAIPVEQEQGKVFVKNNNTRRYD